MTEERRGRPEHYHEGPPTTPRQAATVILLRDGDGGLEVLLVQRNPDQRFMGGAWVFPGGAVDAHEGDGDAAHRAAAIRELEEEASVGGVQTADLIRYSRWITPPESKIRFDTHFFVVAAPPGVEASVDGRECVDVGWFTPRAALDACEDGRMLLVLPTIKHLEQLTRFGSATTLLEQARGREVTPVEPRLVGSGEQARIVLPGEPGYE